MRPRRGRPRRRDDAPFHDPPASGRTEMRTTDRIASSLALILTVAAMLAVSNPSRAEESSEGGWTDLFNGKDVDGWKFHFNKDDTENHGTFTVRDGVLICSGKPGGYMYTPKS